MKWAIIQWAYITKKQKNSGNIPTKFPLALRVQGVKTPKYSWLDLPPIEPEYWNNDLQVVSGSHPNSAYFNLKISQVKNRVNQILTEIILNDSSISAEGLIRRIEGGEGEKCFFKHAEDHIQAFNNAPTRHVYNQTFLIFKKWTKRNTLYFEEITPELINRYKSHLSKHVTKRGKPLSKNSARYYIKIVKILMEASPRGKSIVSGRENPFAGHKFSATSGNRDPLTMEQITELESCPFEENSAEWHARNYWLFSFYCQGIRWRDIATLVPESIVVTKAGKYVKYKQTKGGTAKYVELLPEAEAIFDYYKENAPWVFPILNKEEYAFFKDVNNRESQDKLQAKISGKNRQINIALEQCRLKAGIETHITMHISRHSVASVLEGEDMSIISGALGNTNAVAEKHYVPKIKAVTINEKFKKALKKD